MAVGVKRREPALLPLLAEAAAEAAKWARLRPLARRFAETAALGAMPLRKRGGGEDFWQFRLYQPGEDSAAIDWRRSARDDRLYIRDKQRETAQTITLAPDLRASMRYQSHQAQCSKEERALLWLLLLAEFFAKSGAKLAAPNLLAPSFDRNSAERLAEALLKDKTYPQKSGLNADFAAIQPFSHCLIISDFLDPAEEWEKIFTLLAENQVHISLIAVADPAEIHFPFRGDIVFRSPENGQELYFGQAQQARAAYLEIYRQHRENLARIAGRFGAALLEDSTEAPLGKSAAGLERLLRHY